MEYHRGRGVGEDRQRAISVERIRRNTDRIGPHCERRGVAYWRDDMDNLNEGKLLAIGLDLSRERRSLSGDVIQREPV